jgi:Fur family transcriptional regulator, ferric uptake regulator
MVTIPKTDLQASQHVLRLTRQRRLILGLLRSVKTHPTADELYEMVREKLPHISLGTVYRNLEIMAAEGIIRKLETAGTQKRFDGIVEEHYHVRCVRCGRVDDLPVKSIKAVDDAVVGMTDYQILSHHLEFAGLCPHCKE